MVFVTLAGIGAGAVHALAGPDHLLSLAPLSVGRRHAWRLGLRWGVGHGAGTIVCAAALLAFVSAAQIGGMERWGDLLAGCALVFMGIVGLRRRLSAAGPASEGRGVFLVGLVHGVSGGSALLLILPAVVAASMQQTSAYLAGFVVGSTVAMSALTAGLARVSAAGGRARRLMAGAARVASMASLALGSFWILRGIA